MKRDMKPAKIVWPEDSRQYKLVQFEDQKNNNYVRFSDQLSTFASYEQIIEQFLEEPNISREEIKIVGKGPCNAYLKTANFYEDNSLIRTLLEKKVLEQEPGKIDREHLEILEASKKQVGLNL